MKKGILFCLFFFLVGCDFKEIRNLSIVSTMGIDLVDGKYKINVIVLSKDEGNSKLYEGDGNSFFKAIQSVNDKLTENLYLGHMQNVIVSESISKEGLYDILNYFMKEDIIQTNFYLFLAKNTSSRTILDYLMKNSGYTLSNIFKENHILHLKKNDNSINAFINDMKDEHKDPVIHSLSLKNDSLSLNALALFRNDKLIGFSDMVGYYLLKGNTDQIYLSLPCGAKETILSIHHIRFHTSIQNNQVIHHIKGNVSIKENGCHFKTATQKNRQNIENRATTIIEEKINIFLQDQKRWKVQSLDYKSFLLNKNYKSIKCKVNLSMDKLNNKGDLHE